jgi:hypothetical protein
MQATVRLVAPLLVAGSITLGTYLFGHEHTSDPAIGLFGEHGPGTLGLKSWLATALLAAALLQLVLALWMYGRLGRRRPAGLRPAHRLVGVTALVLSAPIAYHCILAYGLRSFDARTAVHSAAGCFVYGAVGAKLLIVRTPRLPGWALPVAGGTLVVVVAVLWYTSALWYFNDFSLPAL